MPCTQVPKQLFPRTVHYACFTVSSPSIIHHSFLFFSRATCDKIQNTKYMNHPSSYCTRTNTNALCLAFTNKALLQTEKRTTQYTNTLIHSFVASSESIVLLLRGFGSMSSHNDIPGCACYFTKHMVFISMTTEI